MNSPDGIRDEEMTLSIKKAMIGLSHGTDNLTREMSSMQVALFDSFLTTDLLQQVSG